MSVRTVYDERVQPYTPSLYMLSAPMLGRYRSYPRQVITPIPGAGFRPAKLVWGEQVLNLDGTNGMRRPYPYGDYSAGVPLRGFGQVDHPNLNVAATRPAPTPVVPEQGENSFAKFVAIARRIWSDPPPNVEYGASTATLRFGSGTPPTNYDALVGYAKVTAVGAFVGVPVALFLGYRWGRTVRANRRVRRNRRGAR
jgi:hypothetical protein